MSLKTFLTSLVPGFASCSGEPWTPFDKSGAKLPLRFAAANAFSCGALAYVSGTLCYPKNDDDSEAQIGSLPYRAASAFPWTIPSPVLAVSTNDRAPHRVVQVVAGPVADFICLFDAITGARITNAQLSETQISFSLLFPI